METTINAGRVRFVSRGTYNNSTQYYLFDLVDYNGSSYIAKENTLGNLPTNTQYWQLIAEKGNTGSTGQTGPTGATGNGIASITKTETSGLVDTYTITYTNGNTTTFTVTNGEDANITRTEFEELKEENEDLKKNQLTYTPEVATSHYLQDSADSRVRKFIPIGRSVQDGDPTPENPVPIKNTGDNGSVNEKVQNKNLAWNGWAEDFVNRINNTSKAKLETKDGRNCLFFDPSAGYPNYDTNYLLRINWKENTRYTIVFDRLNTDSSNIITVYYTDGTSTPTGGAMSNVWTKGIYVTQPNKTVKYIAVAYHSGARYIDLDTFMVLEGVYTSSNLPDYVPHSEQNPSFPLVQGQKFYEGSHPDDDEKVHHKMRKVVINGSESGWRKYNDNEYYTTSVLQDAKKGTSAIYGYCDKVKREANGQIEYRYLSKANNNLGLDIKQVSTYWGFTGSTVEEFTAWLAENPIEIQYQLENETTEDFTEEQQTAWEQIKKARTYKNVTHISSEDETPANVDITYVRDLETVINNLSN